MKKLTLAVAILITSSGPVYAAMPADANLSIDLGNAIPTDNSVTGCTQGSCFGMELITNFFVWTNIAGFNGINLGIIQLATGSHTGLPDGSEQPDIDQPWEFFKNTGMHQTTIAPTVLSDDGNGNVTLDFSGWSVTWNTIPDIPMNGPPDSGIATVTCANTCENGDSYELVYATAVASPCGGCGFEGVPYRLILRGQVTNTVPPTACELDNPVTQVTTIGGGQSPSVNGTLTTTFVGHIMAESGLTSGGRNSVKICPDTGVDYDVMSSVSEAHCTVNGEPGTGTLSIGDKLICTNKPDGSDVDRFAVKSGL